MNSNSTITDVIDNIDSRLLCIRCGKVLPVPRIVMTQLPRSTPDGTIRGCVGVTFSFLCPECLYDEPSAAEDVVAFFQSAHGLITDPDAWRSR